MKGIDQYKQSSHHIATNEQLVLRVFEKAITLMWEANEKIDNEDKSYMDDLHIVRQLFSELIASLDHESGEELSEQLHQLYVFVLRELSAAGFGANKERLENAIAVAEQLYEGFFAAFSNEEQ